MKFCKILLQILTLLLLLTLSSCKTKNELNIVINDWILFEDSYATKDSNSSIIFSEFINDFNVFKQSDLCQNLIQISANSELNQQSRIINILNDISTGIENNDYDSIRISLLQLEHIDNSTTLVSNQEYLFLSEILLVILVFVTFALFIYLKKYEKKQKEAKQLGFYSNVMIKGMEQERARVSREIHDSVLQDLKLLNIKSDLLKPDVVCKENYEIKQLLIEESSLCIKKLREICNNLTPYEFKNESSSIRSLEFALRNISTRLTERNNIPCVFRIQDNIDVSSLPLSHLIDIFRIVQEALNNIEKHAEAKNVSVVVTGNNSNQNIKSVKVFITDDGKGFDITNIEKKSFISSNAHFGLENMKNRAKNIGGTLEIISENGEGTEIKLEVPLK